MMRPSIHYRVCLLIALAAIWAPSAVTRAEQPPATTPAPAELKTVQAPRPKPQVIYRVPRPSSYAANLHSQSKTQHPLPIDSSMPTSLQMSRAAANEAAARAEQEQSVAAKNTTTPSPQKVKRPKAQSNRPQVHGRGPSKARGPRKSGKK